MASKKELIRQRNAAKKRRKLALKIFCYVFAAIFLNWLVYPAIFNTQLATEENTAEITVTIDDTYYKNAGRRRSAKFWITADSIRYHINLHAMWYAEKQIEIGSVHDLQKGDRITLVYMSDEEGNDRSVVAAYDDNQIYCTFEGYNKCEMDGHITTACVYLFLTGFYSFAMVCIEGWFIKWIMAGSEQRKLEAKQRVKAEIAAKKAEKAKKR